MRLKDRWTWGAAILFCAFPSVAATVTEIDETGLCVRARSERDVAWSVGQDACVCGKEEIACGGSVIRVTPHEIEVELPLLLPRRAVVVTVSSIVGEHVVDGYLRAPYPARLGDRIVQAPSACGGTPVPSRPVAAAPVATPPSSSFSETAASSVASVSPVSRARSWSFALGLNYLFPAADIEYAPVSHVALGVVPLYVTGQLGPADVSGYGGLVTLNYYPRAAFNGPWGVLGGGFYHVRATTDIVDETFVAPVGLLAAGWRWETAMGHSFAVAAGAQLLLKDPALQSSLHFARLNPSVLLEVGFAR